MIIDQNSTEYLNNSELKEMANLMSDAFLTHSNFIYTIKRENKRKIALYNIFYTMYKVINKYGYISVVKEKSKVIGYITFMDAFDKSQISLIRVLRTKGLLLLIKFILNLRINEIFKLLKFYNVYNKYHKTEDLDLKIHLYSTGVDSTNKGKGYMGKAIRTSFTYFFNLGYKEMVLETSDLSNIPIYEKLGFQVKSYVETSDKKQTICFMNKKLS